MCLLVVLSLSQSINASHGFEYLVIRYTFCGLATMILINEVNHLDLAGLIVRQCCLSLWSFAKIYLFVHELLWCSICWVSYVSIFLQWISWTCCKKAFGGYCIRIGSSFDKEWSVDFRGEQTNWLMVATLFGRYFLFFVSSC
jgi:hypothetical protein